MIALDSLLQKEPPEPHSFTLTKKTILRSPILLHCFPQFLVNVTKITTGLASTSVNDENDQTIHLPEQDSYFGNSGSDDESMILQYDKLFSNTENPAIQSQSPPPAIPNEPSPENHPKKQKNPWMPPPRPSLVAVPVSITLTSVFVDNVEYPLPSAVQHAVRIPGTPSIYDLYNMYESKSPESVNTNESTDHRSAEDSILVSLKSGALLLIRVWKVARSFGNTASTLFSAPLVTSSFSSIVPSESFQSPTSHVFRPFVVQWWKSLFSDPTDIPNYSLLAHPKGLAAVSCSLSSLFKIFGCRSTNTGTQCSSFYNVRLDGTILHLSFIYIGPTSSTEAQLVLLVLSFSNQRRIEISTYTWNGSGPFFPYLKELNLTKTSLPLNSAFQIPIMVIPLQTNKSFLFVYPDLFIIVSLHNILSADYSFATFEFDGSFPTSYFIPEEKFLSSEIPNSDEILLATDSGVVYSLVISPKLRFSCVALFRVPNPISVFSLRSCKSGSGYVLNCGTGNSGEKEVLIKSFFEIDQQNPRKLSLSPLTVLASHKSWTPIVDVCLVDDNQKKSLISTSAQELWAITGLGGKTRLTNFRQGYVIRKDSARFDSLRKAQSLFHFKLNGREFIVASMLFESKLLECVLSEEKATERDSFEEILTEAFISDHPTVCCGVIPKSSVLVQVTRSAICFSDLENSTCMSYPSTKFLLASIVNNFLVSLVEEDSMISVQVFGLKSPEFGNNVNLQREEHFQKIISFQVSEQVSMLKCFDLTDSIIVAVGTFESNVLFYQLNPELSTFSIRLTISLIGPHIPPQFRETVPHDLVLLKQTNTVYVGTKLGELFDFKLDGVLFNDLMPETKDLTPRHSFTLGFVAVNLHLSKNDPNLLLACSSALFLINSYDSSFPMRASFAERTDKSISLLIELPSTESQHLKYAFLREDGLMAGSIFCHLKPILKQINIEDPGKKLLYLESFNLLIVLCLSKEPPERIKFFDRKSCKRLEMSGSSLLFEENEMPICGLIWKVRRQGRFSLKLIVSTRSNESLREGFLKILDVSKQMLEGKQTATVEVSELLSVPRPDYVTNLEQMDSEIFFSSRSQVFSTSYSLEKRKLRPIRQVAQVSSDITNLWASDKLLHVDTRMDSVTVFGYEDTKEDPEDPEDTEETSKDLVVKFKDTVSRSLINQISVNGSILASEKLLSSLVMIDPAKRRRSSHDNDRGKDGDFPPRLGRDFVYRMPCIPRIFSSRFFGCWKEAGSANTQFLVVGVTGDISIFHLLPRDGIELKTLESRLASKYKLGYNYTLDSLQKQLMRPFLDKVTGCGFYSLFKHNFDFPENKNVLVDFDLPELAPFYDLGVLL